MLAIPVIRHALYLLGAAIVLPLAAGFVVRFPFVGHRGLLSPDEDDSGDHKHKRSTAEEGAIRPELTPADLGRPDLLPWPEDPRRKS